MGQIKVSVVTIVMNDYKKIEHTMKSVLQQTFNDFEYIIKDGMSTDGTLNVISEIKEAYSQRNIKLISSKDKGIYDAMNQAVSYCSGNWVIFINSGDAFYNSKVLENVFLKEPEFISSGVLYGDAIVRDMSDDMVWKANISLIKKKMPFCHQSCFIKKELLLKIPFDINFKIAADYNNILDIYDAGTDFYLIENIISVFELTGISSTDFVTRYREKNKVISSHGYKSSSKIVFLYGLAIQYIKMLMVKILPEKMLSKMKKYYKVNIKKYVSISDESNLRKGIYENIIYY
ncbi:MAG: glycosyltransferase [Clostridiales bacterium]|nr:glycosyltransferase [Clostridiales bacterium]